MALTFADYPIAPGDGWVNLAAASGYAGLSGASVALQNKAQGAQLLVQFNESGTAPDVSTADGAALNFGAEAAGRSGSIWIRAIGGNVSVAVRLLDQGGAASQVQGGVASGAADAGNPVKVGGVYNSALPALASGQRGDLQVTAAGQLLVALGNGTGTSVMSGGADNADNVSTTASSIRLNTLTRNMVFNGSTWDRQKKPANTARLLSSVATTNAANVKASATDLFRLRGHNAAAVPRYLKLFNKNAAPNVGTDSVAVTYYLPASAPFEIAFDTPLYFSAGLGYAITGGAADNDATAIAAGDILCLNIHYA